MSGDTFLLGVPNVSEGRDAARVAEIETAFAVDGRVLDLHSDAIHNRSVVSLAAPPKALRTALARGAAKAVELIDMRAHEGAHPCVGAIDVCPAVYLRERDRPAAIAEALAVAQEIAALEVPVFLYGALASHPDRRERAYFRDGGLAELSRRLLAGKLEPDLGPVVPHPSAGATLVTARPPLAAFNVELRGIDLAAARAIAAGLRESGGGPAGVRAIGVDLGNGRTQVSTNVHDPFAVPLAEVAALIAEAAGATGGEVAAAEIVGLVPQAALEDFPEELPIPGFDPETGVIERRIEALDG